MKNRLLALIGARTRNAGRRAAKQLPQRVARADCRHRVSTPIDTADPAEITRFLAALRNWNPEQENYN